MSEGHENRDSSYLQGLVPRMIVYTRILEFMTVNLNTISRIPTLKGEFQHHIIIISVGKMLMLPIRACGEMYQAQCLDRSAPVTNYPMISVVKKKNCFEC